METDTIAAISTPSGEGAIAIVRLSGDEALDIADHVYKGKKSLHEVETHTIHYGHIIDPADGSVIEESMISVLRAPKTFTREDIVEINCHGGLVSVNRVLNNVLSQGARLAEPGEFTKRAFLNGRIDLTQAEGVMDLIRAKTDRAMQSALKQVEGRLSERIRKLRQKLLETVANVEVNIDYPEFDADVVTTNVLKENVAFVGEEIDQLLVTARQGKIMREGLGTAIIGRPNVGKSSLMNNLVHENKAIVTEVPGTTRDVLEEYVNVRGVPLRLIDTAGIRETEDIVEKIGVERSRQVLQEAELILLVINSAEPLSDEDRALFQAVQGMNVIVIMNKTDLPKQVDEEELREFTSGRPIIAASFLNDEGIDSLEEAIAHLFFDEGVEAADMNYLSNARHIGLLNQAKRSVNDALEAVEMGVPVDMVQIDITRAWEQLGEIVGENVHDGLIDQLFAQFCLGK
ncbi:tRNA uridine-5-carboxymethylaminomethyl(34) synthesis GTPase MnmE [Marinococcus halophilus]|uniref:tRNA modification GTPase MnmE n=1 Tax=Marinococcus halophilus TaxID=1371 RepID=A0A510Y8F9_MARHA|nr:tRNA uridine-5-carboxymethylaminomethyl(34) synthesis GTPase MnmE [Marinococcus halophilus]OZT80678.1 tRNA uridine-5-carboxymethylaminomethyl(34) synthesis GTPase MnmE [Marinococcus halophilus]GEK59645.1 tRNA modification GTPase MnmE [Marinococcus halophilus]